MAFDYQAVIKRALVEPIFDTAPAPYEELLRPVVTHAIVPVGELYWRAICAYHLPESGGNPNIYLASVDHQDNVLHNKTLFGWTWKDRRPDERANPVFGDKPANEPPANINLGKDQIVTVWVEDIFPSDKVGNLRSDWPDRLYHAATFVAWQLTVKGDVVTPPQPPNTDDEYARGLKDGMDLVKFKLQEFLEEL